MGLLENIQETISTVNKYIEEITPKIKSFPDLCSIDETFLSCYKQLNKQLNQLESFLSRIINKLPKFPSIDFSMLTNYNNWDEKNQYLIKHGWFYFEELPKEIIYEIGKSITSAELDKIIVDLFRKDNCSALKRLVNSWKNSPLFEKRKHIFHQILLNHSRRYFNTSITMLILHSEGIIREIIPQYYTQKSISDIKDKMKNIPVTIKSISECEIYEYVINKIESQITEKFRNSNSEIVTITCRNKISHGQFVDHGNEIISLKQFLYINELYKLSLCMSVSA